MNQKVKEIPSQSIELATSLGFIYDNEPTNYSAIFNWIRDVYGLSCTVSMNHDYSGYFFMINVLSKKIKWYVLEDDLKTIKLEKSYYIIQDMGLESILRHIKETYPLGYSI